MVTVQIAQTTLSQLVARVEAGEEIILARWDEPIAKLIPFHQLPVKRHFGALRGWITVDTEFFEPLPKEDLAGWE